MPFQMRVLVLFLAALFLSVPAWAQAPQAQAPLPPTQVEIKAALNAPDVVEKIDECAGLYRNPDTVKLTFTIEASGMTLLTGAEPELEPDLYVCIYNVIATLKFGDRGARFEVMSSVKLPPDPPSEYFNKMWRTAGGVTIAGITLMGVGAAMVVIGTAVAWTDTSHGSDKVTVGTLVSGSSLIAFMPGAILSLSGLMTKAGMLRSRGLVFSRLGTEGGWIFLGLGLPVTVFAVFLTYFDNNIDCYTYDSDECGHGSNDLVRGYLGMLMGGGALLVGSLVFQAVQLKILNEVHMSALAALPAVAPFMTMSAGPRGSVPVAGLAGIF